MARGILQYIEQDRVSSFKYKCILQEEQTQLSYCLNVNFFATMTLNTEKFQPLLMMAMGLVRSST